MRRVLFLALAIFCLITGVPGCSAPQSPTAESTAPVAVHDSSRTEPQPVSPEVDYAQVYGEILDIFYEFISQGCTGETKLGGQLGVMEAAAQAEQDNQVALAGIGYTIQDISGDQIPELLIGAISGHKDQVCYGRELYAVYTCVNGVPVLSLEGWQRNSYSLLQDTAGFYYQGAEGAGQSMFGIFNLFPDGTFLTCKDCYFTAYKTTDPAVLGFYHNTLGTWDITVSEELELSEESFYHLQTRMANQVRSIALTPFSEYAFSVRTGSEQGNGEQREEQASAARVWVEEADRVLADYAEYDQFIADTSEQQMLVAFLSAESLQDFRVLALELPEVNNQGRCHFKVTTLYAQKELKPDRPLVVGMTFYGSIPHYGISYRDENGQTRNFSVNISGRDESLELSEF